MLYFRCLAFIPFKSSYNYVFFAKVILKYTHFIVTFYYTYNSIMQKIKYLPLDLKKKNRGNVSSFKNSGVQEHNSFLLRT